MNLFFLAWLGGVIGAPGPIAMGSLRRPARRTPLVVVVRRPGLRPYQQVAEEFREHVRAIVQVRSTANRSGALLRFLEARQPDLVLAVGQRAYDLLRGVPKLPLIHAYVYHRQRIEHSGVHVRVAPSRVISAFRLAKPTLKHLTVLASKRSRWLIDAARLAARRARVGLDVLYARSPARAVSRLSRLPPTAEGLWLFPDLAVLSPQVLQVAIGLQFRRRMPLLATTRQHVAGGALFALDYGPTVVGRQAAALAEGLLQRRPMRRRAKRSGRRHRATLRIGEGPYGAKAPRLTVNAQTAKRIGVSLARLRAGATEVLH